MSRLMMLLSAIGREAEVLHETVASQSVGAVPDVQRMTSAFEERAKVTIKQRDNGTCDVVLIHPHLGTASFATKVSPDTAEDMARSLAALHDADFVGSQNNYIDDSRPIAQRRWGVFI